MRNKIICEKEGIACSSRTKEGAGRGKGRKKPMQIKAKLGLSLYRNANLLMLFRIIFLKIDWLSCLSHTIDTCFS